MNNKVAEVLDQAIALMNDGGKHWIKGSYRAWNVEDGLPAFCSVGAINYALPGFADDDVRKETIRVLAAAVPAKFFPGEESWKRVIVWNDAPETTWEDVKSIFDEAKRSVSE
jgi:hypothetical protein